MINFTAQDIMGALLIVCIFTLITLGFNSHLYPLLAMIVGYYFSKRIQQK